MGALAVMAYQTLVSRTVDPQDPAVLTVGAFQAGDANNVIPDSATLKLNLCWYNPKVREQLIAWHQAASPTQWRLQPMFPKTKCRNT